MEEGVQKPKISVEGLNGTTLTFRKQTDAQYSLLFKMALAMWKAMENEEISIHRMSLAKKSIIFPSLREVKQLDPELGIQRHLATMICKMIFENDVAGLTLEIADESVLRVEKDVSVTFAEMLGTIGKSLQYLQWGIILKD